MKSLVVLFAILMVTCSVADNIYFLYLNNCDGSNQTPEEIQQSLANGDGDVCRLNPSAYTDLEARVTQIGTELEELRSAVENLQTASNNEPPVLASCAAVRDAGFTSDGSYSIDPDGDGGAPSFEVYCDMNSESQAITRIHHDSEQRTDITGYDGRGSYVHAITYYATAQQLLALSEASARCRQFIKYECHHSVLLYNGDAYGWWVSSDGVQMLNWGGAPTDSGKCACGMEGNCVNQNPMCNCDENDYTDRVDEGYLTDKSKLPVAELHLGDAGGSNENAQYTLGTFECLGVAPPLLKSCAELQYHGYTDSGSYVIDVDGEGGVDAFAVDCEMTGDTDTTKTIIHHNDELRTEVNGYESGGSYSLGIHYFQSDDQIQGLIASSFSCQQHIKFECRHTLFHGSTGTLYSWWISGNGEKMLNWGGVPSDVQSCACGLDGSCDDPSLSCNCDSNDYVDRADEGYLSDRTKLPVSELKFGDTGSSGEYGFHTLGPLECQGIGPIVMTSCDALKTAGYLDNGIYKIDPDGSNTGVDSFWVECDMTSDASAGLTVFHHNKEEDGEVNGYESPGSYSVDVTYDVDVAQISALIDVATSCTQFIKYTCVGSLFHSSNTLYAWWVSRDGQQMLNWGDVPSTLEGCACGLAGNCDEGEPLCNCDVNNTVERADEGYLYEKEYLPVSQLRFGDTGQSHESAVYILGPLTCA